MFSNWVFYSNGAFLRFDGYNNYTSLSVDQGETVDLLVQKYGTASVIMGGSGGFENTNGGITVTIYNSNGTSCGTFTWEGDNEYTFTIPSNMTEGDYYIIATDSNAKSSNACMAPAVMTVHVYETVQ